MVELKRYRQVKMVRDHGSRLVVWLLCNNTSSWDVFFGTLKHWHRSETLFGRGPLFLINDQLEAAMFLLREGGGR